MPLQRSNIRRTVIIITIIIIKMAIKSSEVPTKPRIRQLLVKESSLYQFYPGRSVVAIGIAQTICGVTISVFGVLTYPLESSTVNLYSGIWIGLIIIVSGLLSITLGRNGLSLLLLKINFFSSIFTTAAISFITILAANSLLCENKDFTVEAVTTVAAVTSADSSEGFIQEQWKPPDLRHPIVMIHCIILTISSLSCLLSLVNFWLTVRAIFNYYNQNAGTILGLKDKPKADVDVIKRRDRVVSWIIEQSHEVQELPCNLTNNGNNVLRANHYNGLQSASSTISTRLYSYGRTIP